MSKERQLLEQWAKQNPAAFEGLKQSIAGAEGTILGGGPGYNVMFGGGRFKDFSRHPDRVISSGRYNSAAAGAYQFMPGTWKGVQEALKLPDFSPRSQDIGMLKKVRDRLLPIGGLSAISQAGTLTPEIQARLAPEWASFPTLAGSSYYGQPVKSASQIQKFFEQGKQRATQAPQALPLPGDTVAVQKEKGNQLGLSLLRSVMGVIPQMQRQRSFIPGVEVELVDPLSVISGQDLAASYLQDVTRKMLAGEV